LENGQNERRQEEEDQRIDGKGKQVGEQYSKKWRQTSQEGKESKTTEERQIRGKAIEKKGNVASIERSVGGT
jgi:hypothetical protein